MIYGCTNIPEVFPTQELQKEKSSATSVPRATTTPTPWSTKIISPPAISPTPWFLVCSPLDGIRIQEISNRVSNKYSPPHPGSDEPHQGVDFSITDEVSGIAYGGNLVNAVLTGEISTIIKERFPYGNAIILETPLKSLPPSFLDKIIIPTPSAFQIGHPILSCPEEQISAFLNNFVPPIQTIQSKRSIYLLYAHLKNIQDIQPGQKIYCGQNLGVVSDSGNALNPHLHLESRVGPSGIRFSSLAHYDTSATPEEMANYCVWRISSMFQLVDPMEIVLGQP